MASFLRLRLSRGTIIAAKISQAMVNLKLWLSKSSSSHLTLKLSYLCFIWYTVKPRIALIGVTTSFEHYRFCSVEQMIVCRPNESGLCNKMTKSINLLIKKVDQRMLSKRMHSCLLDGFKIERDTKRVRHLVKIKM